MTDNAYCGIYRGTVLDNLDPELRMRLRVVLAELAIESGWAEACVPHGSTAVPPIGSRVWVIFEAGDPSRPVWIGTGKSLV